MSGTNLKKKLHKKLIIQTIHLFSFIGKYLVVSLQGHEIVDFLNPNAKYHLLADNVPRTSNATGGVLQNAPIVCGGLKPSTSKNCFVIGQSEMKMIKKRSGAATVALDQSTLWIVGGYNGRNDLK